jgi:hypothetical protein
MISRIHISVALAITAIAWAICLVVFGVTVSWELAKPFSTVVGIMVVFALFLEHVAWKWPWLNGWFFDVPDLRGTWRVNLKSDWINPDSGKVIDPIDCFFSVVQSASKLQMCLLTAQSKSWFLAYAIRRTPAGNGYEIVGLYTNQPKLGFRPKKNGIHLGAVTIETHGNSRVKPDILTGEYWTDRKTAVVITIEKRRCKVFTRYEDAEAAFKSEIPASQN